eukprot:1880051-Alexandrium_andersonii.AAC.1
MAARLTAALGRREARTLPAGATRVGRGGLSALDLVAVPRGESWRWTLSASPAGSLSDHAAL